MQDNQLKIDLDKAATNVMHEIDSKGEDIGVFVIRGKLITTSVKNEAFEKHMKRFADCLVGVYNVAADYRWIKADLALFA